MVKFLIIIKSNDEYNVRLGLNMAQAFKSAGAEDVKIFFTGPAINALNRKLYISNIISENLNNLKNNNIQVLACRDCMNYYCISNEDLIHYDEISDMKKIYEYVKQGYLIITI